MRNKIIEVLLKELSYVYRSWCEKPTPLGVGWIVQI